MKILKNLKRPKKRGKGASHATGRATSPIYIYIYKQKQEGYTAMQVKLSSLEAGELCTPLAYFFSLYGWTLFMLAFAYSVC